MANDATMVIKTTSDTKALIKRAADKLGLSISSFVVMVAKNAASSNEIVIKNNTTDADLAAIDRAEKYNARHKVSTTWAKLKAKYDV
ncbi:DUF1778 domain-containing protein [Candidatus Saccharibacteria bacterium]|nr:DUF1778 domain-containing protein [Candidatus Saccharibacteria bacterium]